MSTSRKQTSKSEDNCAACNKTTGDENWLSCEICEKWFHAKCMNIKDEAYKVLKQLDSCHWYCRPCNAVVGKLLPTLVSLADKIGVLEEKITKVDTDLEKSRGRVSPTRKDPCSIWTFV